MASLKITEGEADFSVPAAGKACKTWYKVFGDLKSGARPLIGLHGGPGAGHNYLMSLEDLTSKHGIPVILYDQLGTGRSTHLQEKNGDTSFWTIDLFLRELDNLLKHLGIQEDYDVFGNSWGGMLGAEHAVRQPVGLHRLVIADSPADMGMWVMAANKLRRQLPQEVQDVLKRHEDDGTTDSSEYEEAVMSFYKRHLCRVCPMPEEVVAMFDNIKMDPTVYHTMNGPSEFYVTGSLKDWAIVERLHKINAPTLLINGRYDEATDEVVEPYFEKVGKAKWVTFTESSHMPHLEERDRFIDVISRFLKY
ncbi:proline iminopeptidase [Glonium stellatum]|uniref:Proline iminopeptidase n=1 Tax=Glonium stellatum TaxID=574774 RepID=A0A8E2EWB8_9PEZI|nr:proline iminopeptidase [Glonium stellatum]